MPSSGKDSDNWAFFCVATFSLIHFHTVERHALDTSEFPGSEFFDADSVSDTYRIV